MTRYLIDDPFGNSRLEIQADSIEQAKRAAGKEAVRTGTRRDLISDRGGHYSVRYITTAIPDASRKSGYRLQRLT